MLTCPPAHVVTSHKEGGTNISWNGERLVRSDYGDYPDTVVFPSESEFLEALRKFYDWETSKNVYPEKTSDLVAWKLRVHEDGIPLRRFRGYIHRTQSWYP